MSASFAAVILAHDDPDKVRRLISTMEGAPVFLHCDKRAPDHVVRGMVQGHERDVHLVRRHRTSLNSWSLVEAEFQALSEAISRSTAEHIAVLSGSCHPLLPIGELEAELARWRGLSRIQLNPFPYDNWNTPRNPDGGYWRVRRRFVTFRGEIVSVGGSPLRTWRARIPRGLRLHASSQWKVYARAHAAALLRALDEFPEQLRFWRRTLVPDECCAASILSTPALVGEVAEQLRDDSPWFVRWPSRDPTGHPSWLGGDDYPALLAARTAPLRDPDEQPPRAARDSFRKLFARKFSSAEERLLERIDVELRA